LSRRTNKAVMMDFCLADRKVGEKVDEKVALYVVLWVGKAVDATVFSHG